MACKLTINFKRRADGQVQLGFGRWQDSLSKLVEPRS